MPDVAGLQVGVGITPPRANAVKSVMEFGYTLPKGNDTLPSKVRLAPVSGCRRAQLILLWEAVKLKR